MYEKTIVIIDRSSGYGLHPEIRKFFPTQFIEQRHLRDVDQVGFTDALFHLTHFSEQTNYDCATIITDCTEEQIRLYEQAHQAIIIEIESNYINHYFNLVGQLIGEIKALEKLDLHDWKRMDLEYALIHRIRRDVYRSY